MTHTPAAIALSVQGLQKTIGKRTIIRNITFDVQAGEVFGFLGPNGAGKTTTIRMIVGLIAPTAGRILIDGHDVRTDFLAAMHKVGCIVENPEMYKYMTGWQNLEHFATMLGDCTEERIHEVVQLVKMDARIHDKVKSYSLGMRQRLGIAQALLGRPKLLILDEPTNGLDPAGIRELREFIRTLAAEEGLAVFVSSHMLAEVQMMCDRVAILSGGEIVKVTSVHDIVEHGENRVEWTVDPLDIAHRVIAQELRNQPLEQVGTTKLVATVTRAQTAQINEKLIAAGVHLYSVTIQNQLEELFLQITGGESIA
ncbi:ABC transporter ATP-binding protein [Tumebacillus permanentifrigoris]|uniref:ABC-2 type transport system ATP-binding protein n=1 Tax=Tumebacillus permanentifrigoris TaxID=378543 RepID=A0A316D569_9BACL|nr:ABC transporter ATP-binding protein [Tumebacillus permanentifrigoris]PWK08456.1 ABC-2 type transport system ATP-binding protein [Tumebacillus permanentifrigoris]